MLHLIVSGHVPPTELCPDWVVIETKQAPYEYSTKCESEMPHFLNYCLFEHD